MTGRRSSQPRRHLVVMVKVPRPGRVKTRLGRDIGMVSAAWWYRHQVARLLRQVHRPKNWRLWLAVSPDVAGLQSRTWPSNIDRIAQGDGDLGDRMSRIFRSLPHGPVLIIGSDIPGIDRKQIASAFKAMAPGKAAIGPADDGGYWAIGLPRGSSPVPHYLFRGVRWSGPYAMQDTIETLGEMELAKLETLRDIDTGTDLHASV